MNYWLSPEAASQIWRVARHYAGIDRRLATSFVEELKRAITLLREQPYIGFRVTSEVRRALVRRFPYLLLYRVNQKLQRIEIVAIANQRGDPASWQPRVKEPVSLYRAA